ncbi:tyrosinase-like protein 2 [Mytilus trossulus]|uniref:tyrosinase-like protein 2 n=1 Tax=Mytilus trossulus TaxID=6551 RepID=UPI003003B242
MRKILIIFASLPVLALSLVVEDDIPPILQECYNQHTYSNSLDEQTNCLQKYLFHLFGNSTQQTLVDKNALDWVDSLGRSVHHRLKRQTRYNTYNTYNRYNNRFRRPIPSVDRRRVRKEIRTLTDQERQVFFDAINALKNDKSASPNQYDVLALMHQTSALTSAHRGPNFPSWHRYFLLILEEACVRKRSTFVLPYWDSSIDFRMSDPSESVLWTEIFLGNGRGVVYTGPFAMWRTPTNNTYLRRDIPGANSSLINPDTIVNVFRKRYNREILTPTAATEEDNLENHHDGVHRWVGGEDGHMGGLETSPQDPVFFLHHCYIDYLWEVFRERQQRLGINTEEDYPETTNENHHPNRIMDNLSPPRTNKWGYSNIFTERNGIYRYAPAPTCANRCGGAYNGYLFCNRRTGHCEPRTKRQFIDMGGFRNIDSPYINDQPIVASAANTQAAQTVTFRPSSESRLTISNPAPSILRHFEQHLIDPRTRTTRKKRSIATFGNDNVAIQSSFYPNLLATIPVKIVNTHHSSGNSKNSFENVNFVQQISTLNVSYETVGFSYNGNHTGHIIIDEKTQTAESTVMIAFKKPMFGMTTANVRVFDSYGGICKPECFESGSNFYKDCSGVLKITADLPLMFNDLSEHIEDSQRPYMIFNCHN